MASHHVIDAIAVPLVIEYRLMNHINFLEKRKDRILTCYFAQANISQLNYSVINDRISTRATSLFHLLINY
jgi:hypothetical protein